MLHTCTVCVEEFNCTSEYSKHSQYLKGFWRGSRCCHWPFIPLFSYNSIHLHTSYNCNKQEKLFLTYGSVDRTTPCREPAALKYPDPQIHKVYILAWHLIDLDKQITVIMNMTLSSYSNCTPWWWKVLMTMMNMSRSKKTDNFLQKLVLTGYSSFWTTCALSYTTAQATLLAEQSVKQLYCKWSQTQILPLLCINRSKHSANWRINKWEDCNLLLSLSNV